MRHWVPVVCAAVLFTVGCSSAPAPGQASPRAASFDHAAAALPDETALPEGYTIDYRCPGGEPCATSDGVEGARIVASAEDRDDVDEAAMWPSSRWRVEVEYHATSEAAAAALDEAGERLAETGVEEFAIEPEELENGFRPGREGGGTLEEIEREGWSGVEAAWTETMSAPDGDRSAPRQVAETVLVHEHTLLRCGSTRYADEGDGLAQGDCRAATDGFLARLAELDPDEVPVVLTASRLAAALPADENFPEGTEVQVRCPGDAPCTEDERQTQDASISVHLPLPEGVRAHGDGDRDRFRVPGGEWTEMFWLRAWLQPDADTARQAFEEHSSGYGDLVGDLNTEPRETDSGYDYGIRGRGEVIELDGESWSGRLKVYDARFVHLDGRIGDRRYDIRGAAHDGRVLVTIESSLTVEGRDQDEAVDFVRRQLQGFFERLAEIG